MGLAPKVRTLLDIIRDADELADCLTIFAVRPWTPESRAIVVFTAEQGGSPEPFPDEFEFFLHTWSVIECLEYFDYELGRDSTFKERCDRLIRLADEEDEGG